MDFGTLLPGEKVLIEMQDISYICPYDTGSAFGTILVTTYKLSFRQNKSSDKVCVVILCTVAIQSQKYSFIKYILHYYL